MGLPTEILTFFNDPSVAKNFYPHIPHANRTLFAFASYKLTTKNENYDVNEAIRICNILENEGLLLRMGTVKAIDNIAPGDPAAESYLALNFDPQSASIGTYDFLVYGFFEVYKRFKTSVRQVVVTKPNGDPGIGTCFVVGSNTLITAFHCIDSKPMVKIVDEKGKPVRAANIWRPSNQKMDLAIIQTDGESFKNTPQFMVDAGEVLDEVLIMGYPEVDGFDAPLISTIGNIVATDVFLRESLDYHLLNAKLKGGNSSGPVIDRFGAVVGIIISFPSDTDDTSTADEKSKVDQYKAMGFGMALTGTEIMKIKDGDQNPELVQQVKFKNFPGEGFKTA